MPLVIFLVLAVLMFISWDWLVVNIDVLGAIATSLAFCATAWAAHEARKSAKAALKAVKTADETLSETKNNYRRDIFEKRYSLLLEQHNNQLQNVYNYLFASSEESKLFSQKVSSEQMVIYAAPYLNGHSIISPYMRTLYHLLKHINENFYLSGANHNNLLKKKKEYSSPLRSIIRNDVLYLIGVNCLVRKRVEKGVEVDNGYGYYQDMLNSFDFFEHAIFFDWKDNIQYESVRQKMDDYLESRYTSKIESALMKSLKVGKVSSKSFISYPKNPPVILALAFIYSNPTSDIVNEYFKNVESNVMAIVEKKFDSAKTERSEILKNIVKIKGMYIGLHESSTDLVSLPISGADIVKMIFDYKISNVLSIRGMSPTFFSLLSKHSGCNSFGSDVLFFSSIADHVRNYLLYSKIIEIADGDERNLFAAEFVGKSKEFVTVDENILNDMKRLCN
ncbi:putative phage abortive infection protein [Citrobacter sp.]|uniref:putative phage abortive infection protein n=1 Tax=Citrobacter sp. TaxID=1896336 RepID=UPI002FC79252